MSFIFPNTRFYILLQSGLLSGSMLFLSSGFAHAQQNLLQNPGFEEGTTGWDSAAGSGFTVTAAEAFEGTQSIEVYGQIAARQEVSIDDTKTYRASGQIKKLSGGNVALQIQFKDDSGANVGDGIWQEMKVTENGDYWQPVTHEFSPPIGATKALMLVRNWDNQGDVYFDDISIVDTSGDGSGTGNPPPPNPGYPPPPEIIHENLNVGQTVSSPSSPPQSIGGTWQVSFVDEFDGGNLNGENWKIGSKAPSVHGSSLAGYESKNIFVKDGALVLKATNEPTSYGNAEPGRYTWTSGEVTSYGLFKQKHGYWEARIKSDKIAGMWPAFWMMPERDLNASSPDLTATYNGSWGKDKWMFLKFDASGFPYDTNSVVLNIPITEQIVGDSDNRCSVSLYGLDSGTWDEDTLTWNNKPALEQGVWLFNSFKDYTENSMQIDVTRYVLEMLSQGETNIGFMLRDDFETQCEFTIPTSESSYNGVSLEYASPSSSSAIYASEDTYVSKFDLDANYGNSDTASVYGPWLNNSNLKSGNGQSGIEYDIYEVFGSHPADQSTFGLHYNTYVKSCDPDGDGKIELDGDNCRSIVSHRYTLPGTATIDQYNTFGMLWDDQKVQLFVNGVETRTIQNNEFGRTAIRRTGNGADTRPIDHNDWDLDDDGYLMSKRHVEMSNVPEFMLLSLQVGGFNSRDRFEAPESPDDIALYPGYAYFDYVKVWERVD